MDGQQINIPSGMEQRGELVKMPSKSWESVVAELQRLSKFGLDAGTNQSRAQKWLETPPELRAARLRAVRPKISDEVFNALWEVSNPIALDIAVEEQKQSARQEAGIEAGGFTDTYLPEYAALKEREVLTGQEEPLLKKGLAIGSGLLSAPGTAMVGRPQAGDDVISGTLKTFATDPMLPLGVLTGGAATMLPKAGSLLSGIARGAAIGLGEGAADVGLQYGREQLTPGSAALSLLGGGVLGAGGAAFERGMSAPLASREAKFAPRKTDIAMPSVESPAFGKELVRREQTLAEGFAPVGVDPKKFSELDPELRGIVIRASETPEDNAFFSEMLDLSQKYVTSGKKREFNPFVKLGDTKGKEALDKFTNQMDVLGKKIQATRDYYKDQVNNVMLEDVAGRIDWGGGAKLVEGVAEDGTKKRFFAMPNGREITNLRPAQKEFLKEFTDVDLLDGNDIMYFRDKLRDQIYSEAGGRNQNVDAGIVKLYKELNATFDNLIAEAARNPRIAQEFSADRARWASLKEQAGELDKAFGKRVNRNTGEVTFEGDDGLFEVAGDATPKTMEQVRKKLYQRLKTISKNPENWDDVGEILKNNTGIDVLKYADLTRGAAEIAGVPQSRSLLKAQEASAKEVVSKIRPEFASIIEKFRPTDKETMLQLLAQAQGKEAALPWYQKPYASTGLSILGKGAQAAALAGGLPGISALQYLASEDR